MVQLEEVEDEELDQPQAGTKDSFDNDDDFTDTDSSLSDDELLTLDPPSESLTDRLLALRDMLPPSTRRRISATVATTSSYLRAGLGLSGKTLWVVSTSALLLGVPWALAFAEEAQMVEMEKEQRMRDLGNEVSAL
ncbi:mitochondrial import receptor protein [Schaereria dolodes]|nr:mitochondrial import receptor protein [Schaereria dolodes]